MKEISVGGVTYRIETIERNGRWIAAAVRTDSGRRFGSECTGESADRAASRLAAWLEWQYEHTLALEALQEAEHAYHRTIAGSAFASPIEGPSPIEMQKELLDVLEAARVRLDEVRSRKPD
jgi:hypothetical protein